METVDMRKALHHYIDESDDRFIRMMYALANAYSEEDDYEFSEEEIKQFEKDEKNGYEVRPKHIHGRK